MGEKVKKPFYKKWWVWLVAIVVLIGFANTGEKEEAESETESVEVSEKVEENEPETVEVSTNETEVDVESTEEESNTANEEEEEEETVLTRDNSSATETTLNTGTFLVGPDIPAGRYVITGDGSGNLFVYDGDMPVVNEILDPTAGFGVTSVTTDLEDGQEIEISGINAVTFAPAKTEMSTTLSTGTWEVGLDVEAGRYDVTTQSGSGNFFVFNAIGFPEVNEILDASGDFGVPKLTTNLEEGQIIEISGLNQVEFTAK